MFLLVPHLPPSPLSFPAPFVPSLLFLFPPLSISRLVLFPPSEWHLNHPSGTPISAFSRYFLFFCLPCHIVTAPTPTPSPPSGSTCLKNPCGANVDLHSKPLTSDSISVIEARPPSTLQAHNAVTWDLNGFSFHEWCSKRLLWYDWKPILRCTAPGIPRGKLPVQRRTNCPRAVWSKGAKGETKWQEKKTKKRQRWFFLMSPSCELR